MTIEELTDAIVSALKSESIKVISLAGKWGVGKTHLWHDLVANRKAEIPDLLKRYSYVSLFGIRTLSELKSRLLINAYDYRSQNTTDNSLKTTISWLLERTSEFRSGAGLLGKGASVISEAIVESLLAKSVRNVLVCFDDFERAAREFEVVQLMGLVEQLRVQDCKVVIIFNREKLSQPSALDEFHEKVFDREIALSFTIDHSLNVSCKGLAVADANYLAGIAKKLELCNIRVLRKIRAIYEECIFRLPLLPDAIKESLMTSAAILSYCHFVRGENIPTLKDVLSIEYVMRRREGEPDPHMDFLANVGWTHLTEADKHIARFIRDGYCDWAGFSDSVNSDSAEYQQMARHEEIHALWREYARSFRSEEQWREFGQRLYKKHIEHIPILHAPQIDSALGFLKQAKMNDMADELLGKWETHHLDDNERFNLERIESAHRLVDTELRDICRDRYKPAEVSREIISVLTRIAEERSWSGDDSAFLMGSSAREYVEAFRGGELTDSAFRGVKFFLRLQSDDSRDQSIKAKIHDALSEIAKDSNINRAKIEALGIELAPEGSA